MGLIARWWTPGRASVNDLGRPRRVGYPFPVMPRSRAVLLALLVLPLALGGCRNAAAWFAMPFLYEEASLPDEQVVRDVPYRDDPAAHPEKHRLDLFLPAGEGPWPVLVFVHGGGWTRGDRAERDGGGGE